MPDVFEWLPYNIVSPSLTTLSLLAVKVAMYPSSHSCPIDMRSPDCRWGEMWDILDAWVKRGFIFISSLWVACMMLPSGRMIWGIFFVVFLFLHGVFTLI